MTNKNISISAGHTRNILLLLKMEKKETLALESNEQIAQLEQIVQAQQEEIATIKAQCCTGYIGDNQKQKKNATITGNSDDGDNMVVETEITPSLEQNQPNPFTEETIINYSIIKSKSHEKFNKT